jgi:hypothetical protein
MKMSNFTALSAAWKASDSIRCHHSMRLKRNKSQRTSGSGSDERQSRFDCNPLRAIVLDLATVLPARGLKADTANGSRSRTAAFIIIVVK